MSLVELHNPFTKDTVFKSESENFTDVKTKIAKSRAVYTHAVNEQGGQACHMAFRCPVKGGQHNCEFDIPDSIVAWGSSFYLFLAKTLLSTT